MPLNEPCGDLEATLDRRPFTAIRLPTADTVRHGGMPRVGRKTPDSYADSSSNDLDSSASDDGFDVNSVSGGTSGTVFSHEARGSWRSRSVSPLNYPCLDSSIQNLDLSHAYDCIPPLPVSRGISPPFRYGPAHPYKIEAVIQKVKANGSRLSREPDESSVTSEELRRKVDSGRSSLGDLTRCEDANSKKWAQFFDIPHTEFSRDYSYNFEDGSWGYERPSQEGDISMAGPISQEAPQYEVSAPYLASLTSRLQPGKRSRERLYRPPWTRLPGRSAKDLIKEQNPSTLSGLQETQNGLDISRSHRMDQSESVLESVPDLPKETNCHKPANKKVVETQSIDHELANDFTKKSPSEVAQWTGCDGGKVNNAKAVWQDNVDPLTDMDITTREEAAKGLSEKQVLEDQHHESNYDRDDKGSTETTGGDASPNCKDNEAKKSLAPPLLCSHRSPVVCSSSKNISALADGCHPHLKLHDKLPSLSSETKIAEVRERSRDRDFSADRSNMHEKGQMRPQHDFGSVPKESRGETLMTNNTTPLRAQTVCNNMVGTFSVIMYVAMLLLLPIVKSLGIARAWGTIGWGLLVVVGLTDATLIKYRCLPRATRILKPLALLGAAIGVSGLHDGRYQAIGTIVWGLRLLIAAAGLLVFFQYLRFSTNPRKPSEFARPRQSRSPELSVLKGRELGEEGAIVDSDGRLIGQLCEGDLEELIGMGVGDDGEILDSDGDVVGRAELIEQLDEQKEVLEVAGADQEQSPYRFAGVLDGLIVWHFLALRTVKSLPNPVSGVKRLLGEPSRKRLEARAQKRVEWICVSGTLFGT